MIIAHISDIHVGPQFVTESFTQAVKEITELKPDVILATGDFTENGLLKEYERAASLLSEFEGIPMVTVPGNHDYRFTGYLPYRKVFGENQRLTKSNTTFFAVSTARPDRDEGEVGHRQIVWLEDSLRKSANGVGVVVMHHHLISVPDTGSDRITVVDAGDALKSIFAAGAELVVCGHRHRPWMWKINDMTVAHAGTTSSERTRGYFVNTYNVIDLNESNGKSKVWLKVIGGKRLAMSSVIKDQNPYMPGLEKLSARKEK